jgi:hypothetical protein
VSAEGVEVAITWHGELLAHEHVAVGSDPSQNSVGLAAGIDLGSLILGAPTDGTWHAGTSGSVAVHVRRGGPGRYMTSQEPLERGLAWAMTGAMTVGIAFLLVAGFVPPAGSAVSVDALSQGTRLVPYVQAPPEEPLVPRVLLTRNGRGPIADGDGQPMVRPRGVAGAEESPRSRAGRIRFHGDDEETRRVPRAQLEPQNVGVLGVLRSVRAAPRPGALGGMLDVEGWTRDDAYGRPLARLVGVGHGASGFDMVGTGRGGCAPGDETCGEGTVGVGSRPGFGGTGWGTTCGETTCELGLMHWMGGFGGGLVTTEPPGRRSTRASALPRLRRVRVRTPDGLTRDQIRRVVRLHREEVRHCYADSYSSEGAQAGRVEVGVVISPNGDVLASEVTSDALGDAAVSACIVDATRRWSFPTAHAPTSASLPFHLEVHGG